MTCTRKCINSNTTETISTSECFSWSKKKDSKLIHICTCLTWIHLCVESWIKRKSFSPLLVDKLTHPLYQASPTTTIWALGGFFQFRIFPNIYLVGLKRWPWFSACFAFQMSGWVKRKIQFVEIIFLTWGYIQLIVSYEYFSN